MLSIFIILFSTSYLALFRVNVSHYFSYLQSQTERLATDDLAQLVNGNSLINLPSVTFSTTNPEIEEIQRCTKGPRYLGGDASTDYTSLCFSLCGSVSRVVEIEKAQEYYHNDVQLSPGYWCLTNQTQCNLKTGYVVASINGVVCHSKYPSLFGGEDASLITACNNEYFPKNSSVLWDYLNNEAVNPQTVQMTSEDELLPDGSYRFKCKFGLDVQENQYIPHPLNRFEPLRDPCKKTLFKTSLNVGVKFQSTNGTDDNQWTDGDKWICDCGNAQETRVSNVDPNDRKSQCSSCVFSRSASQIQTAIDCYTINADYGALMVSNPCNSTKFVTQGNLCDVINITYSPYRPGIAMTRNLPTNFVVDSIEEPNALKIN